VDDLEAELKELRKQILLMALHGAEGHIPSSLSILDLVWAIYDGGLVSNNGVSKFVLSKGHGCDLPPVLGPVASRVATGF
jgi:transketolase N-terminal domain/subunit